jgi:hypothetical protein
VAHTFSPEASWRAEALAGSCALAAAVLGVIVFVPSTGSVMLLLHGLLEAVFGKTTFVIPLALALIAGLAFARRASPNVTLPRRKLLGLGLITIALLPAQDLLGQSTGLVGEWFTGFLLELIGGPLTLLLTLATLMLGSTLTFELTRWRGRFAAR